MSENDNVKVWVKRETRYRLNLAKAQLDKGRIDDLINDLLDLLEESKK